LHGELPGYDWAQLFRVAVPYGYHAAIEKLLDQLIPLASRRAPVDFIDLIFEPLVADGRSWSTAFHTAPHVPASR
jgi:hypothetical protein